MVLAVGVAVSLLWPVEVSVDYNPKDVLLVSGDTVIVSASSSSWNSWLCSSWEWDVASAAGSLGHKKQTTFQIAPLQPQGYGGEFNKVSVDCIGSFIGKSMGSEEIQLYMGYANSLLIQIQNSSDVLHCPTDGDPDTLVLSNSVTQNLQPGDIVGSTLCGSGFLFKVVNAEQQFINTTSLEDVFAFVELPPTAIPYTPLTVNATVAAANGAVRTPQASMTLVDETNWVLPFTMSVITGSVTFDRLVWDVSTDLQSLHYDNGKFQSLTWHSSTTVTTQITVSASLLTSDVYQSTVPLFKFNAPPVAFPVPILEIVTVNADFDVDLELTATVRMPQSYAAQWSLSFVITYEWSVTCARGEDGNGDLSCSISGVVSQNEMSTAPVGFGMLSGDVDTASTVSVEFSGALLLSVGVQLDQLVALNDKLSVGLDLSIPATWVDVGGVLPCPTISASITDALAVDLRIFVIDIRTLFDYTIYSSGVIPISVSDDSVCSTASPTLAPASAPSVYICPYTYPQPLYILAGSFDTQCDAFGAMCNYAGYLCANGLYSFSPACGASGMTYKWEYPDCGTSATPNAVTGCGELRIHTTCNVPGRGMVECDLTTEFANPLCNDNGLTGPSGGCGYAFDETDPITPMIGLFYFETQPFAVETKNQNGYCYCSNGFCSAGGTC